MTAFKAILLEVTRVKLNEAQICYCFFHMKPQLKLIFFSVKSDSLILQYPGVAEVSEQPYGG